MHTSKSTFSSLLSMNRMSVTIVGLGRLVVIVALWITISNELLYELFEPVLVIVSVSLPSAFASPANASDKLPIAVRRRLLVGYWLILANRTWLLVP